MTDGSIRFLHASDCHLERPLQGACELPERLREWFLEAPYRATQRLFDAAITESVDFVVLAGDVLDANLAGPRGAIFLLKQLERLQAAGIALYWVGGSVDDPIHWPAALPLPKNVVRFPAGRVTEHVHHRRAQPVACLRGASRSRGWKCTTADFAGSDLRLPTIAVTHGRILEKQAAASGVSFWALGGKHAAQTFSLCGQVAHYPGTPQGRQPGEPGPHGATLVRIDERGTVALQPLVTDTARWLTMRLQIDRHTTAESLERLLCEATGALRQQEAGADLLIRWKISGTGPLCNRLWEGSLADDLLAMLRREFGESSPAAWSLSLDVEPPELASYQALEDETLLGDFLRTVRHYQATSAEALDLSGYLGPANAPWGELLQRPARGEDQDRLLREVARLGSKLLAAEVHTP